VREAGDALHYADESMRSHRSGGSTGTRSRSVNPQMTIMGMARAAEIIDASLS